MALASVDKLLTIAIPTYNRPAKIRNTVSLLLPQLHSNVKVLILDNCSPVNVANYLKEQIGHNVLDEVEVIRHKTNIGGDANFQRCFELCNTPYIWMLGDDDKIENNALEIILKEIAAYRDHDIVGINFSSNILHNVERHTAVLINNTEEFTQKLDHFGNLLFISATVYKTQEYLKYLHLAAWGAYGMASQLIPAMVAISYNKVLVLSEKYIVTNLAVDDPNENGPTFR
jgi:glycosyltransferase involved in cell wall biosynthesis